MMSAIILHLFSLLAVYNLDAVKDWWTYELAQSPRKRTDKHENPVIPAFLSVVCLSCGTDCIIRLFAPYPKYRNPFRILQQAYL